MDGSKTVNTLEDLANIINDYDIAIILFFVAIFFILMANIKEIPYVSLNDNQTIKTINFFVGLFLLAISIVLLVTRQNSVPFPPSPPTTPTAEEDILEQGNSVSSPPTTPTPTIPD